MVKSKRASVQVGDRGHLQLLFQLAANGYYQPNLEISLQLYITTSVIPSRNISAYTQPDAQAVADQDQNSEGANGIYSSSYGLPNAELLARATRLGVLGGTP